MRAVSLEGYKSFFLKQRIKLAPVTIFAGANSSGKSSALQPLLLMKQTIESQYDPGTLLLAGANIKFTSLEQMLSKRPGENQKTHFTVEIEIDDDWTVGVTYSRKDEYGIGVKNVRLKGPGEIVIQFWEGKQFADEEATALTKISQLAAAFQQQFEKQKLPLKLVWSAVSARCFPDIALGYAAGAGEHVSEIERTSILSDLRRKIVEIIHIQGLRGNPERTYPSTARISKEFPGVFTDYVASALQRWQEDHDPRLELLGGDLKRLGLSWKVETRAVHDTQVEIRVSRLPGPTRGGARDVVSLADVGLGVSQVLPFLVALRVAKRGQI